MSGTINNNFILAKTSPLAMAMFYENYKCPKHLLYLQNKLFETLTEKNKKLIITMPPRHGKSETVSKYFVTNALTLNPKIKIILTSYESSFAESWSIKAKEVYRFFNPEAQLKIDRQNLWETMQGGSVQTAGAGGSITGKGADILIIDDPIKNASDALSPTIRQKIYDWYNSVALTRLEPSGSIIIVQTRWHLDDLSGRLLQTGKYEHINFPAIAMENDILGRKAGEALWSERYNIDKLNEFKNNSLHWFNCLYQQSPTTEDTEKLKREYWKYLDESEIELSNGIIYQSWDTAFKTGEQNDYTVCTTWLIENERFILLDLLRKKIEFPQLEQECVRLARQYNPEYILIEDKGSGQSLIQSLKQKTSEFNYTIKPIIVDKDKNIRVEMALNPFHKGQIYIKKANWNDTIINECAEFPLSAHDDIVDSITQMINYIQKNRKLQIYIW